MTRPYYTTYTLPKHLSGVLSPAFFPANIPAVDALSIQSDANDTQNAFFRNSTNNFRFSYAFKDGHPYRVFGFFQRSTFAARLREYLRRTVSADVGDKEHLNSSDLSREQNRSVKNVASQNFSSPYNNFNYLNTTDEEDPYHLEEDLMDGVLFQSSLFLVLANRVFAIMLTLVIIATRNQFRADITPKAPLLAYFLVSLSNVIATSCQYEALKWLTFPTLTVGKCAKMLPVMLILNFRKGKRYSSSDFAVAFSVVAGSAIMILTGNIAARRTSQAHMTVDTAQGFFLLGAYLLFDALTSTYQEHLFQRYSMSVYNQMLYINLSTSILASVGLVLSGGMFDALAFLAVYPAAFNDIAALSVAAVVGQFAISHTIQAFGALIYAGIMTFRQFCSVLISNLAFKHGLTPWQWFGATLVFSSLFIRVVMKSLADSSSDYSKPLCSTHNAREDSLTSISSDASSCPPRKLSGSRIEQFVPSSSAFSNCSQ